MEARADGIHWFFTPMLDIARDARWGRVAEGFGEDPFLASLLAEASVTGYQKSGQVLACAKHFVGYGAAEGGRDYDTTEISESTLRNVYLRPYRAACRVGVATVMAAFHEIGGEPTTASRRLLTEVLREEFGWEGLVTSDWGAVLELTEHGVAEGPGHASRLAITAGLDVDMASICYSDHLADEVREGRVSEEVLDTAVSRMLQAKARIGLFDEPYTDESLANRVNFTAESQELALRFATRSTVLLQDSGVLPLPVDEPLVVCGPLADARGLLFGTWTLDGEERDVVSPFEALRALNSQAFHLAANDDATSLGRFCRTAVAVVGESPGRSGENNSVTNLGLPPGQTELLESLRRTYETLVVVVISGRPLALPTAALQADALVWAFHPGVAGGLALADLLTGRAPFTGRLPITLPRATGQVPLYYAHKRTGRPLHPAERETRYIDEKDTPRFPFGYGLTGTGFEYEAIEAQLEGIDRVDVRVRVRNVGGQPGEELVQLYLRDEVCRITRSVRELAGFAWAKLAPGEATELAFRLGPEQLGVWDNQGRFGWEPGAFTLIAAPHALDPGLTARVVV